MKQTTKITKQTEIKRGWHLVNAEDQVLGRLATKIARLLIGKDKTYWTGNLDCGDYVIVTNAAKIKVTGQKVDQKLYHRHSGYPGGFKEINFARQKEKDPRFIIRHAIWGMLPKNKLQDRRLARLKVYVDEKHPYGDKFKTQMSKLKTIT